MNCVPKQHQFGHRRQRDLQHPHHFGVEQHHQRQRVPQDQRASILNSDTLTLSYVTIASNSSGNVSSGSVTATGTIIAGSTQEPNCIGNRCQEPSGFNLDSGTSCRLSQATDLNGIDPLLAPLASNGGPTQTQALKAASPRSTTAAPAPTAARPPTSGESPGRRDQPATSEHSNSCNKKDAAIRQK